MVLNKRSRTGLRKRWSASASVKLPLGSGQVRLSSRGLKSVVKREINKSEETKVYTTGSISSTLLKHNTIYTLQPTQFITQGTDYVNRTGNTIFLRHVKLKGLVSPGTANYITYRVMGIWSESQYIGASFAFNSGVGVTDLFHSANFYTYALVNPKLPSTVIYDKLHTVKNTITGVESTFPLELDLPIMRKMIYQPGSGLTKLFKDKQLYIIIIPYVAGGTSGTTNVGAWDLQATCTFKDA